MAEYFALAILVAFLILTFAAWRRYLWAAKQGPTGVQDTCPYSVTESFGNRHLVNVPHQEGVTWLTDVFSRSAQKFPNHTALQIPHTGESLTYAELNAHAEDIATALAPYVTGPDQIVAVAMSQDNWQIVACHLGILKAGAALMFLDTTLPDALITHMLNDAEPVAVLTRGETHFRDRATIDTLEVKHGASTRMPPSWMDDPTQRLATVFYTSGTTGKPKGVECHHAGYVNLALSYADYFDLLPGMDATTLTSSLGYDGSISEMYCAWVSGCSVVLLTKDEVRSGPDLVPILRDAEVTVLFCPPLLLATLTEAPERDLPYPICRYIVPAGEAFPSTLVEPWTRCRRQIINTYGPTEASTDTSRQTLRPGEPVTIGTPLANVTYVILDPDGVEPRPHGMEGELCIGGVHVARGYRNLPDQTAQKFINHAQFGRIYRTGDKCRIDRQTHRVDFLGRIDTQLKVRGHRVEAQAVEDILQNQFPEIEAAVLDYQSEALVAFVYAPSIAADLAGEDKWEVMAAPAAWADATTRKLAAQLPEPSVPTSIFLVESFTMKPVSGKIDRDTLPDLSVHNAMITPSGAASSNEPSMLRDDTVNGAVPGEEPPGEISAQCKEILELCRAVFDTSLGPDDRFMNAGGHSIAIARLAQRLQVAGRHVPVRALLGNCDTARKLAEQFDTFPRVTATADGATLPPAPQRHATRDERAAAVLSVARFTTLQVLFAFLLYLPGLAGFFAMFSVVEFGAFFLSADLSAFIFVGIGLYLFGLVLPFASLPWVMLIKFLLGGHVYKNNVTSGVYPKWSKMHLRLWCIRRLEKLVMPLGKTYRSAPLLAFVLRQLGADVGKNLQCAQDAGLSGPLDLLTIEDDVAIQTGAYVQVTRWVGSELHVGPIHLGAECKIGMRSAVSNDVTIGKGTWITPFTPILESVGDHEVWEGAPARLSGHHRNLERSAAACKDNVPLWKLETLNVLFQVVLDFLLGVIPGAVIFWFVTGIIPTGEADLAGTYFKTTPLSEVAWNLTLYAFISAWITVVVSSLLTCLFLRATATTPGLYSSRGLTGALLLYRLNKMNQIQGQWTWTITGQYLRALAGVRFSRVGATECDVMFNLVPELATVDSKVFWSNGSFTNMLDYGAEHIAVRHIDMGRNFFSGNNCVLEHGHYPANFLLGVSTLGNDIQFRRQMRTRAEAPLTVVGNPSVTFASACFDAENETQKLPGFPLFLSRMLLNDFFSIGIVRIVEMLIFTLLYISLQRYGLNPIVNAMISLVVTEIGLISLCVALKQGLIGNKWGVDDQTPFWSWKHFAYFFAQDCFFVWCKGPLGFSAGTVLSNPILRLMGCQVGQRTLVAEPLQCSDWNAVRFGNDCVIEGFLQFHTFENMLLKVKRTHIMDGCTVAFGATVMGGAHVEPNSTLSPLSLVLKEMHLRTGIHEGAPAEPVGLAAVPSGEVYLSTGQGEGSRSRLQDADQPHATMQGARAGVSDGG